MYKMYADGKGWNYELLSCTPSDLGGYKEYVMVLSGPSVYRCLRYEGGLTGFNVFLKQKLKDVCIPPQLL